MEGEHDKDVQPNRVASTNDGVGPLRECMASANSLIVGRSALSMYNPITVLALGMEKVSRKESTVRAFNMTLEINKHVVEPK